MEDLAKLIPMPNSTTIFNIAANKTIEGLSTIMTLRNSTKVVSNLRIAICYFFSTLWWLFNILYSVKSDSVSADEDIGTVKAVLNSIFTSITSMFNQMNEDHQSFCTLVTFGIGMYTFYKAGSMAVSYAWAALISLITFSVASVFLGNTLGDDGLGRFVCVALGALGMFIRYWESLPPSNFIRSKQ